jgi:hypothetical protein
MSRPVSSPKTLTINWDQAITQDKLNEVSAFKKSLGHDARVLFNRSGNTETYTEHRESLPEKFFRKLDKFEKNVQAAWSWVNNLFTDTNQGNSLEATKNIKGTPTNKSLPSEPSSISVKRFNSQIANFTNTIPVFVELQYDHRKAGLSALETEIKQVKNLNRGLDFFTTPSRSLEKVKNEFLAFQAFAKAQAGGKTFADQNRDAINFAKGWAPVSVNSKDELIELFGKQAYEIITTAALELASSYQD